MDISKLNKTIIGTRDLNTFRKVKHKQMELARVVRKLVAEDLDGTIRDTGKQFIYTRKGTFRIAMTNHSDNSTEQLAHDRLGAQTIPFSRLSSLYRDHGKTFNDGDFLLRVKHVIG